MNYYQDSVVHLSWQELAQLNQVVDFILIGGWATYLYTQALKSKDIDVIINYDQLAVLEKNYELYKNKRLKKYEARKKQVQIDVYVPYYSQLGLPLEEVLDKFTLIEGFKVLDKEWLMALKIFTLKQRGRSHKGRKDFFDLVSLWQSGLKKPRLVKIITQYKLQAEADFLMAYADEFANIPELGLNNHQYAQVKRKIQL